MYASGQEHSPVTLWPGYAAGPSGRSGDIAAASDRLHRHQEGRGGRRRVRAAFRSGGQARLGGGTKSGGGDAFESVVGPLGRILGCVGGLGRCQDRGGRNPARGPVGAFGEGVRCAGPGIGGSLEGEVGQVMWNGGGPTPYRADLAHRAVEPHACCCRRPALPSASSVTSGARTPPPGRASSMTPGMPRQSEPLSGGQRPSGRRQFEQPPSGLFAQRRAAAQQPPQL